jgi:hypothetical protein
LDEIEYEDEKDENDEKAENENSLSSFSSFSAFSAMGRRSLDLVINDRQRRTGEEILS